MYIVHVFYYAEPSPYYDIDAMKQSKAERELIYQDTDIIKTIQRVENKDVAIQFTYLQPDDDQDTRNQENQECLSTQDVQTTRRSGRRAALEARDRMTAINCLYGQDT